LVGKKIIKFEFRAEEIVDFRTCRKDRDKTRDDLEAIAIHECSHALVFWLLGGKLRRVTLTGLITDSKESKKSQTPYFCEIETPDFSKSQEAIALRAKAAMAPAAVEAQRGEKISAASYNDIFEVMGGLTWGNSEAREMASDAMRLLKNGGNDWETSSLNFFEIHGLEIRKIIADPLAERCVDELSKKLLMEGEIDGHEAVAFFEKIWGGRPEKAWPARFHSKDSKIASLPAAMEIAGKLTKLALDNLRSYSEKDLGEEKIINEIAGKLLGVIFQIDSVFSKL
jgi:hypothetical protein